MFKIEKALKEDAAVYQELDTILQEANVVRMDAPTLKRKLYSQSILLSAKEAGDPLYRHYVKASKLKKELRKKINVKYAAAGKKKMREFLKARKQLEK